MEKDTLEVPIRTYHIGVLGKAISLVVALAFISLTTEPAAAATTGTTQISGQTRTTNGVVKTAYQKRKPVYKRYVKPTIRKTVTKKVTSIALPPETAGDGSAATTIARAKSLVGARYRWGGTNVNTGFDCSGFVRYVLGEKANGLPRSSYAMYRSVQKPSDLKPGDLVFFRHGLHAGIYIGNNRVIHASTPRSGVKEDDLSTLARALGLAGVGRI